MQPTAITTDGTRCAICAKDKATLRCGGCLQEFCHDHIGHHRQDLSNQFDELQMNGDLFRQTLMEMTTNSQKNLLMQQIDDWQCESINKIRQTADETRQLILKYTDTYTGEIQVKLNQLTVKLRQSRQEDNFNEIHLRRFREELARLTTELSKTPYISIKEDSISLINKICVDILSVKLYIPNISANAHWTQNGVTVAGGNGDGIDLNQLYMPWGLYIDDEQTVYVADWGNHRIMEWKYGATCGRVVAGGNGPGNRLDQLNHPTDVTVDKEKDCLIICDWKNDRVVRWSRRNGTNGEIIMSNIDCCGLTMDDNGHLYVSDYGKHEAKQWKEGDTYGTVVAGGNKQGNRLDQLNRPTYISIDREQSVYVSDSNNHRVMKWKLGAKEGILVAGGQSSWNNLSGSSHPRGIAVDRLGTIYVVDSNNHQVIRWPNGAEQGNIIIGDHGKGDQSNQLKYPRDLSFDRHGNLYIVDQDNHRVQRFNINSSLYA